MAKKSLLFDIANYFLYKAQKDGELISQLKLQKLVYYSQMNHRVTPLKCEKIKKRLWDELNENSYPYHDCPISLIKPALLNV